MMLAFAKSRVGLQTGKQLMRLSASRLFATKTGSDNTEAPNKEEKAMEALKEAAPV